MIEIAYWTNKLDEDTSSRVHAKFKHGESEFLVVHDWREGMRGHGFIVLEHTKAVIVRKESPR